MKTLRIFAAAAAMLILTPEAVGARDRERVYNAENTSGFVPNDTINPRRATEFSVFYGAFPASNFIATYRDHYDLKNSWGTVGFSFDHSMTDRWIVGVSYNFSTSPGLYGVSGDDEHDLDATWHTLLANVRYVYLRTGRVSFYGHAAVGVTVGYLSPEWRDSYNITRFAFQVSPIGVQYGLGRRFACFAEAGLGMQGIVQAGLRLRFL